MVRNLAWGRGGGGGGGCDMIVKGKKVCQNILTATNSVQQGYDIACSHHLCSTSSKLAVQRLHFDNDLIMK